MGRCSCPGWMRVWDVTGSLENCRTSSAAAFRNAATARKLSPYTGTKPQPCFPPREKIRDFLMKNLAVVAIGGNSLIKRRDRQSVEDQYAALCETMGHVADVIASGRQVLLAHGNGPQIGFVMRRSEIVRAVTGQRMTSLPDCAAQTQGAVGYQILQALGHALRRRNLPADKLAALVTRTRVKAPDPAMNLPSRLVGEWYDDAQLPALARLHPDWTLRRDADQGWRRAVPSPEPLEMVDLPAIRALLDAGFHVAAGGGIPVADGPDGLNEVDAALDNVLAAAVLANSVGAETLLISTAVEQVCLDYGTPDETPLSQASVDEVEGYEAMGHFPPDNMGPKIRAAINFLRHGGREAIITCPERMREALTRGAGTHIRR